MCFWSSGNNLGLLPIKMNMILQVSF
uniref:Uncharacterized protein n=1 Tax=Arundo donax TaxID=35708 RepID=A0A0A9HIH0_ARUDO